MDPGICIVNPACNELRTRRFIAMSGPVFYAPRMHCPGCGLWTKGYRVLSPRDKGIYYGLDAYLFGSTIG